MAKLDLKKFLSEMTAAQSPADKEFEALHPVKKTDAPAATEAQFKGVTVAKDESKLTHSSNATGMVDDLAKTKPLGESFEDVVEQNLQELSRNTLHSYAAKAKGSAQASRAVAKFARSRDEYDRADEHKAKAAKRTKGAKKAASKLSEEQLDELSKKTLGSYIEKAATSRTWSGMDMVSSDKGSAKYKEASATASKRRKGIKTAVKKLTKEDIDAEILAVIGEEAFAQLDEISKHALGNYIKHAGIDRNFHSVVGHQNREWAHSASVKGDEKERAERTAKSEKHLAKSEKRQQGIHKAVDKLVRK